MPAWSAADDEIESHHLMWSDSDPTGMVMKGLTALLATTILLAGIGAGDAAVRIVADPGGRIGAYLDRYQGCVAQARW